MPGLPNLAELFKGGAPGSRRGGRRRRGSKRRGTKRRRSRRTMSWFGGSNSRR